MEILPLKIFRRRRHVSRNDRAEKYSNHVRKRRNAFKGLLPRLVLVFAFVLCGVLLFPPTHRTKDIIFKAGEIADREIIAPFSFRVPLSAEELDFAKAQAAVRVLPVYVRDSSVEKEKTEDLEAVLDSVANIISRDTLSREEKLDMIGSLIPYVSSNSAGILLQKSSLKNIGKAAKEYQKKLLSSGLIDNSGPLRRHDYSEIVVVDGNKEKKLKVKDIVDQGRLDQLIKEEGLHRFRKNREKAGLFFELVRAYLLPNLILDVGETQKRRNRAAEKVPKFFEVSKNERIIGKHDKVTKEQENILKELEKSRASKEAAQSPLLLSSLYAAETMRLLIFSLLFGGYLFVFHKKIYQDFPKLASVFSVMMLFLIFMSAVARFSLSSFLIPVSFVALMLTSLFDYRLGLVTMVFSCILISLVTDIPYNVGFVSLMAGTTSILGLKRLRARSHFYTIFLYISLAYIVGIFSIELGQAGEMSFLYKQSLWGIANGLFSSASVMFLLPVFESVFNLITRFTLLELTDLNRPILKRLNMEAHGTYHHSMLIGNLVDSVAEDVGADPLKARVMAYYHDIGKIFKPEYFAENQDADFNKHEKITPQMSSLILVSHVKDGVELAREEKLPDLVMDAIREHHGTTVMAYFYQKALETDSHSSVKKDDFRYPGPRPRSKESAILMLADTVEAACRSLKDPAPAHIRNMVVKLVDARAREGELDESSLTLSDLARIREKFISILTGIYHKRVAYPGQEKEEVDRREAFVKPVGRREVGVD